MQAGKFDFTNKTKLNSKTAIPFFLTHEVLYLTHEWLYLTYKHQFLSRSKT